MTLRGLQAPLKRRYIASELESEAAAAPALSTAITTR